METTWNDLLDPDEEELRRIWPEELHPIALDRLLSPHEEDEGARPKMEAHGDYILGTFVLPVVQADEDRIYYQQLFLLLTQTRMLTVRKTPPDGAPFDPGTVRATCANEPEPCVGMYAFHLIDDVAERYLTLVDAVASEIDELEERVETSPADEVRQSLSNLRHDLLRIRRMLAPTRDAVRAVVDNRLELDGGTELFPRWVEVHFGDAYDKFLRASEGIELARDLVAGVRDYHQAKVANDQNEVMKRLTVIASILLVPTLIVGVYGQNLQGGPELEWSYGYWWSWLLIAVTTVAQLIFFRKKRWI